jgi:hypothetical protein
MCWNVKSTNAWNALSLSVLNFITYTSMKLIDLYSEFKEITPDYSNISLPMALYGEYVLQITSDIPVQLICLVSISTQQL